MKKILLTTIAAAFALSLALPAVAATSKQASANVQASCKAQAAKKFSAIHFLKRRNFVNQCVAQHNNKTKHARAKTKPANANPAAATMGQAPQPTTTGQAPKQPPAKQGQ